MIYSEREKGGFSQVTVTAANLDCRLMIDTRAMRASGILGLKLELFSTNPFMGTIDY